MKLSDLVLDIRRMIARWGIDPNDIFPKLVSEEDLNKRISAYIDKVVVDTMARRVVYSNYKTWLPTSVMAFEMYRRDLIKKGKMEDIWELEGIKGEVETGPSRRWADIYYAASFKFPSIDQLSILLDSVESDRDWVKTQLKHNLLDDTDVDYVHNALVERACKDFQDMFIDQCFSNLRVGILPEASWPALCGTALLGTTQTSILIEQLDLEDHRFRVQLRKDVEAERLRQALITPADYVTRVQAVGVDPLIANAEAELIMAQRGIDWSPPP